MDAALRRRLRSGVAGRPNVDYLLGLLDEVEQDPVWPKLLATLDMYGRSGRFYYLDILGDRPQEWESPMKFWDAAEQAVLESDPELKDRYFRAIGGSDLEASNGIILEIQCRVADSLSKWWAMVCRLAVNGALGEAGKAFGWEVGADMVGQ